MAIKKIDGFKVDIGKTAIFNNLVAFDANIFDGKASNQLELIYIWDEDPSFIALQFLETVSGVKTYRLTSLIDRTTLQNLVDTGSPGIFDGKPLTELLEVGDKPGDTTKTRFTFKNDER